MAENTNPKPQTEVHAGDALKTPAALREEAVLSFWQEHRIFEQSLKKDSPKGNFVSYDGPPYATGLPHFGHMLPSTIKDIIPRYKTMQGYHVPRRWGWDCHGLPIENLIEKELGLKDKKAIEEYGIEKFNKAAKDSVFRFDKDWKRIVGKLGRWVDMENDYHTMDPSYTESVWWSFKTLNDKELVYEDFKVMPYCPRCQTTLSNFEVGQGYKDIPDISAYVLFERLDENRTSTGENFLAWTTTPWTLPGNTALAVHPDLEYSLVSSTQAQNEETKVSSEVLVWVATDLISKLVVKEGSTAWVTKKTAKGSELVGSSYKPPFDFYAATGTMALEQEPKRANAWKVYAADFVTAEDGTGIVHIAPAYGDDDSKLASANNIPMIHHVAPNGQIKEGNGSLSDLFAKPKNEHQLTDIEVIKLLAHGRTSADAPLLFAKEKITHSYPHCWRCETPLLNYATSSWFVRVTSLRDKLVAENNKINWVPKEVGEGRMGKWLENVRDWTVSRSRYWGAALPVWKGEKTGKTEFIGSVADLASKIKGNGNTFLLMRHGECETNVKNIVNSNEAHLDLYALTERGRSEVATSIVKLKERQEKRGKKFTKIYASDFRRTKETALQIAEAFDIDPSDIRFDVRLREINVGDFDGQLWTERSKHFASLHEKIYKKSPNGESVADVKKRTAEFLYDIEAKHTDEEVLIVTHGLPLRLMLDTTEGKTNRDLLRSGWTDVSEPTASFHECAFKPLPHNEDFELDLHRPFIDAVEWIAPVLDAAGNPTGETETMKRVPEVFDVWYDSGSMPFAQSHYPFECKDAFEKKGGTLFPADFIAEGLDQTRGWFYSMLVLSVALFGESSYKNVIVNGLILAEDGRKMSKSLKNYPDVEPTVDKYGGDSMRFLLATSPATHAEETPFTEKALDDVNKKIFNRLENVYSFYKMYADAGALSFENATNTGNEVSVATEKTPAVDSVPQSKHVLDKWIISRLSELKLEIEQGLESYQIDKATRPISLFVDDISTWYLRRSRDRFKGDDISDKQAAIDTTRFTLLTVAKLIAPFTPFMAEHMYQNLRKDISDMSSALAITMPQSVHLCDWPTLPEVSAELITSMDSVRKLVETGLALRSKAGVKVRQPLSTFTFNTETGNDAQLSDEFLEIMADELNVKNVVRGSETVLDTNLTQELKEEGLVRDVIRAIQEGRKNANLQPHNPIKLELGASDSSIAILKTYIEMIRKPVLAETIDFTAFNDQSENIVEADNGDVSGEKVSITIHVASHISN